MPELKKADAETVKFVHAVMQTQRPDLAELDVRVEVLMASPTLNKKTGLPKGPAIKRHGARVLADIRITSAEDRLAGMADAVLRIDAEGWEGRPERRREALVFHELTHLEVMLDKEGLAREDGAGRPKLKARPHDIECGFFLEAVRRYGHDAAESDSHAALHAKMTQLLLPFGGARDAA